MLKAFFRDSAVYGLAKVLTGGITLLSLPIYTHALPPGEYGIVDLITSLATIAHVTVALEIAQGLGRFILAPEAEGQQKQYASTALWFTLATYSLFAAAVIPLGALVSRLLFQTDANATIVRVATLVIWTTGIFNLVQNLLRYGRRAPKYALVSILFSVTNVGVTILLLLVLKAGVVAMFIGQFSAGLAAVALGLFFARDMIRPLFDRERAKQMLKFSIPLVPSGIGIMLCMYVDRFAVLKLLTVEDLGRYAVAFRIATVVAIVVTGFDAALAPLIYQNHHKPETPGQLARMLQWFLALAAPLLLFLGIFAKVIVGIVAPAAYAGAASLVFMLSASMLMANLYNFSPGLWVAKRTGWVAVISLGSGVLNLAINFLLIPRVGLIGAAIGTITASLTACAAHYVFGRVLYPVPFQWGRLGIAIAAVGTIGVMGPRVEAGIPLRAVAWVVSSLGIAAFLLGADDLKMILGKARSLPETLRARRRVAEVERS